MKSKKSTQLLLKKPETMVGLVVFAVAGIVLARSLGQRGSVSGGELVTPAPDVLQESEMVTAEPVAPVLEKIDVLADTNSGETITVREGDTFWKLARKHCGSGSRATTLREANGFTMRQLLHEGDKLTIVCE